MGISPHHSDGSKSCPLIFETFEVPLTPTISLSAVEDGVYDISFAIVGAETWKGQGVVAADAKPTEILLKPGSDLRYKIIAPEGAVLYPAVLLKDGKSMTDRFDFNSDNYEGLPCGNYVLHVPSSAEGWRNRNLEDVKVGPDEIPWRERDIPFTISDGSPAIIDLGQIRLERLP